MGILCDLLGYGTKKTSTNRERQLVPARDPPEFKPGPLADTGILWVQFFRKLLIPKHIAADYTKELGPPVAVRQERGEDRRTKKGRCKCRPRSKCPITVRRQEPNLVDPGVCKEFRESVRSAPVELRARSSDTKTDTTPPKCGNKPTTTTIHCDKCHTCTRIVDCTGHRKPENK